MKALFLLGRSLTFKIAMLTVCICVLYISAYVYMFLYLRSLVWSLSVCAAVQLIAGSSDDQSDDVIHVCLGPHCYTAATRESGQAFKSKADAAQWCRSEGYGELASVNSQREQDDIDTFRFSVKDLEGDHYFINTQATVSPREVVC